MSTEDLPVGVDDLPDRGVSFVVCCRERSTVASRFLFLGQQAGSHDPLGFVLLLFSGGFREAAFVEFPFQVVD